MPAVAASAPGKIILFGEHAAVYGRPAIAVPVTEVRAKATITADPTGAPGQVLIKAGDIGLTGSLDSLPAGHPLAEAVRAVVEVLGIPRLPSLRLTISSTIPIASGLGSGAAVTAAIARALSGFLGRPLSDEQISAITYQVDQIHHGTPSGIDNTVISYAQPVFFIRNEPLQLLHVVRPFTIVIGNTGIASQTREVVGDVRRRWQAAPEMYNLIFDQIGAITRQARTAIENGPVEEMGPLLTQNHALLVQLDVSCPALDQLVEAALAAGALGAKLCGSGKGGNMIALVAPETAPSVAAALRRAGAVNTITTSVGR